MKKKKVWIVAAVVAVVLTIIGAITAIIILNSSPGKKTTVIRKKVVVVNDNATGDDSQNGDELSDNNPISDMDSFYDSDTDLPSGNGNLQDGLFYVAKKVTRSGIGKNYYVVTMKDEHPGVVGYDAVYEVAIFDKMGNQIPNDDMIISVNHSKVKNQNGILTVPYSVRKGNEKVVVSVQNKKMNYLMGEYIFDFQQFTESTTFKDDFNTLNTDMWVYQKSDGKKSDAAYIEEGCLVLKSESGKSVTSLSSAFKQSYGCFSARIKMHEKGLAKFSLSLMTKQRYIENEDLSIESGGEITAVEYYPYWKEKWSSCVRWFGWNSYSKKSRNDDLICENISEKYHTFSVVWTPKNIFWYLDGSLVHSYSGEGVGKGSSAMNLCLKLNSYDKDNYRGGPFEPDAFPFTVKVDRIEAYGLIEK